MLEAIHERWLQDKAAKEKKMREGLAKRFAILMEAGAHNTAEVRQAAQEAVATFATFDMTPLAPILDSVQIQTPGSEGYSIKLNNVRLNLTDFMKLIGSGWLALSGEWGKPLRVIVAFLILWSDLKTRIRVHLSKQDAAVIWTMWQKRNPSNEVEAEGLLDAVNQTLRRYGEEPMSESGYQASITHLLRIQTIERTEADRWRICESVTVNYLY